MKKAATIICIIISCLCNAQTSEDYTLQVNTTVQSSPPKITFHWPLDTSANHYVISRKLKTASAWTPVALNIPNTATQWTDSNLVIGNAFEYRIIKSASLNATTYVYSGVEAPAIEYRGKLILLVDSTFVDSLANELAQLRKDLISDGWQVLRHDVSRTDSVTHVKSLIYADYQSDSLNVKAVYVFGHIPVPYSGDINPDGHPDHLGAWPADVYYANMHGVWTDDNVNDAGASRAQNKNIIGDGKFDQSTLPSPVDLQIGRVDLSDMPSIPYSEQELLRRYLNKEHAYKVKSFAVRPRALVDDNFGAFSGEAFASCGWRMCSIVGADSISSLDYFTNLDTASYQWSYGCGGGTFTSCGGVGATSDCAIDSIQTIFTMLFGSYFGDWDSQDNFLRAPLASGTALTSSWAGRPYWNYHHMALGENIGYSALVTQNNSNTYLFNYAPSWIHIALMGDPTLRMHVIAPPSNLTTNVIGLNRVDLHWNPSPDTILGYYVYRQDSISGVYNRISPSIISSTGYIDNSVVYNTSHYMVRAIRLEHSASGTYYNLSLGSMDTSTISLGEKSIIQNQLKVEVFPNPSNGKFFVDINNLVQKDNNGYISVYNFLGEEILHTMINTNQHLIIDLANQPAGIYFLSVNFGSEMKVLKIHKL